MSQLPVEPARFVVFLTVMASLASAPGPANLYSIANGMHRGPRAVLLGVVGMNSATLVWFVAAALACGALFGLAGCETATPYQPLNTANRDAGGYSDHQIEANRFQVSFSGNSVTSRETVERYLLYRSAELTLAAAGRSTDRKT